MNQENNCLALLGTGSVQGYIFGSNRLKENAGASFLTTQVMEHWDHDPGKLFVGGGNAAVVFAKENARSAIRQWSRDWIEKAPGLRVTAALVEFADGGLQTAFREAQKKLFFAENAPPFGADFGALPVVRICPSTGGPASQWDAAAGEWVSTEAKCKRDAFQSAEERLEGFFALPPEYKFPRQFEHLGMREEASQIAIVHADGNGIGRELTDIAKQPADDEGFREKVQSFSETVSNIAEQAFKNTLRDLAERVSELIRDRELALSRLDPDDGEGHYFPLRPIVYGGDDLTFVCHGRLGLALAVRYLEYFEAEAQKQAKSYTSCAGVLIMPMKFPFARGYELAEELCARAKQARAGARSSHSWIDFHVVIEGISGSIERARELEYRSGALGRPYRIGGTDDEKSWQRFEAVWNKFRGREWPRSRAKRLFEALARGNEAARRVLAEYNSRGVRPAYDSDQYLPVCFDALELLDFHVQPWTPQMAPASDTPALAGC